MGSQISDPHPLARVKNLHVSMFELGVCIYLEGSIWFQCPLIQLQARNHYRALVVLIQIQVKHPRFRQNHLVGKLRFKITVFLLRYMFLTGTSEPSSLPSSEISSGNNYDFRKEYQLQIVPLRTSFFRWFTNVLENQLLKFH